MVANTFLEPPDTTACLVLHNMAVEFGTRAPDSQDDNNDNDDDDDEDNTVCNDKPAVS